MLFKVFFSDIIETEKSNLKKKKKAVFSKSIGCVVRHQSLKKLCIVPKTSFKNSKIKSTLRYNFIEFNFIKLSF